MRVAIWALALMFIPAQAQVHPSTNARTPQLSRSELVAAIGVAVVQLRQRLPMRVDSVTNLTGIRSEGTNIVYLMSVSQDIASAHITTIRAAAQAANQAKLCREPHTRRLIGMGASMTHQYTDTSGDTFQTSVSSCPPSQARVPTQ